MLTHSDPFSRFSRVFKAITGHGLLPFSFMPFLTVSVGPRRMENWLDAHPWTFAEVETVPSHIERLFYSIVWPSSDPPVYSHQAADFRDQPFSYCLLLHSSKWRYSWWNLGTFLRPFVPGRRERTLFVQAAWLCRLSSAWRDQYRRPH